MRALQKMVLFLMTINIFWMYYLTVTHKSSEPSCEENNHYQDDFTLETDTEHSPSISVESPSLLKTIKSIIKSIITGTTDAELTPSKVPPTTALQITTERGRTIFFLETANETYLNCRQACAVESAAKHNPNMNVMVFHISEELNFTNSLIDILAEMPNVEFKYLPLDDFMDDSPLKYWYHAGEWEESQYKISHLSDALRFLTLWKFGGIYLDLDVVVLKSLDDLVNCTGFQLENIVAAGVLAFDKQHPFMYECLLELNATYDKNRWAKNGPRLIARVLKRECAGIDNLTQVSREKCKGVMAYPPDAFYAIYYPSWRLFFNSENASSTMQRWKNSYLIHVWNKLSVKRPIKIGSGQPYELVAIEHCPEVHAMCAKNGSF